MSKQNQNVCPGCSKHCTADAVRCKRGQRYFEGLASSEPQPIRSNIMHSAAPSMKRHEKKPKWERHVSENSLLRRMLLTSRCLKELLRGGVPEEQLLMSLSDEERGQLEEILNKMNWEIRKFI